MHALLTSERLYSYILCRVAFKLTIFRNNIDGYFTCWSRENIETHLLDWFKDGTKIVPERKVELRKQFFINSRTITSILTKTDVRMSDTGTYSCGTSDLQVTSVSVQVLNSKLILPELFNYLYCYIEDNVETFLIFCSVFLYVIYFF
jgi:hypothetical protein